MNSTITLITGSSRGLGRSTALAVARQGGDVVVTYHSRADAAREVVAAIEAMGRRAVALALDVADVSGFADFTARLRAALRDGWNRETFDHLVNNGAPAGVAPFAETSEALFDGLVDAHFKGVYFLTQALLPLVEDGGSIVNLSSGLSRFSLPGFSAYAAMKGAIDVLTRYLALELGPRRIRVNAVAPGAIATDFGGGAVRDNPEMNRGIAAATALGRVGLPDDIGPVIARLLDRDNGWINGQRIEVSGGIHL